MISAAVRASRKSVLWLSFILAIMSAAFATQLVAGTVLGRAESATSVAAAERGDCVDVYRTIDPNILVTMSSEELEYLQSTLCAAR
jgi:hypothetical protein